MPGGARILTPKVRRKLKRPVGRLFLPDELSGGDFAASISGAKLVVTVGDRVTETLHLGGRTPDVQVVDLKERRVERDAPAAPYKRLLKAGNPAGSVTDAAAKAVVLALKSKRLPVRVQIEGEEDLLTLPAVAAAPPGAVVVYGQPKVGLVVVAVDRASKASAERTLASMPRVDRILDH